MNWTFGQDPEFMIVDKNNELKSAINILPKKEEAIKKNGHCFYFDNVLAEIAVKPAKNIEEAIKYTKEVIQELSSLVYPYKLIIKSSGFYPQKEINCPEALIAACNEELDVYTLRPIYPSDSEIELINGHYRFKTLFRSAGGHIHLGSEFLEDSLNKINVIRAMDLFIGVPSLFLDLDPSSKLRRKIYGKAGSHRDPEYGLEYRSLSNFWLTSPKLVSLIYKLSEFCIKFVEEEKYKKFWEIDYDLLDEDDSSLAFDCFGYDEKKLIKCINHYNKKDSVKFMELVYNELPNELIIEIEESTNKTNLDFYKEWNINV